MTAPDEFLAPIRERLAAATPGPWFLNDCDGEIIVLPESDLVGVARDVNGKISSWGLPISYRPERRILELELDSWDRDEDEQDDQVRDNAEFIAHAPSDTARLLAAIDGVLSLHYVRGRNLLGEPVCSECIPLRPFPCPTVAAVQTALEGQG